MTEAHDPICAHITTDHPVRQARMKRLIDDASVRGEVLFTLSHKCIEREFFWHAAALRFQGDYGGSARPFHPLNFPDTLSGIAVILLEYPHASRSKPRWKALTK